MTILDNPVWHALQTQHRTFAQGTPQVQRYAPGVLQLMGGADPADIRFSELRDWLRVGEKLFTVGDVPTPPPNWKYVTQYDCLQMLCEQKVELPLTAIEKLQEKDLADMLTLINIALPGFFHERTPELGDYYGIRKEGQLVAMAGERMRLDGLTEVSAVATHPDFTGRGYAQQVVAQVVNKNLEEGNLPFLHVTATNERAVGVYRKLGFVERRKISFCQFEVISL
jgi:ribosomal protein S18 acetylase RimI-like enzyme